MNDSFIKYIFSIAAMGAALGYIMPHYQSFIAAHQGKPLSIAAPPIVASSASVMNSPMAPVEILPDHMGQFVTQVDILGRHIPVLVDTGATYLSLTIADARQLGIIPRQTDFTVPVQTANGVTMAAKVKVNEVRIGHLQVRDVDALILPGDVAGLSLLGMSFLRKLGRVEVASGSLILRQ